MVNGIVSLVYFSNILLLMCRNATDSCVLILYPETLLNSLMSSTNFMVVSSMCNFTIISIIYV